MKRTKVAVIGVGLLGGSIALALQKRPGFDVVGWNHRASSRRRASKIVKVAASLEDAVRGASVVVVCAHSGTVCALIREIQPWLDKDALVLDVSSLKKALADEAMRSPGMAEHFVPCHPMAGKEKSGPEAADASLYEGRWVFVTPLDGNPTKLVARAEKFWKVLGAKVLCWKPSEHDRRVALTSHVPHLLACVMMELYGRRQKKDGVLEAAVGSGFRDFTRISAGHPVMWADIMRLNASEIGAVLKDFRKRLQAMEKDLKKGRREKWVSFFENAQSLRERL